MNSAAADKTKIGMVLVTDDIDTEATLNGAPLTDVEIDPWVFGVSYVHRF